MKQLYKHTRVILIATIFYSSLSAQLYLNCFGQHAASQDVTNKGTPTKEKNKPMEKEKVKGKAIAKKGGQTKDNGTTAQKVIALDTNLHWWDALRLTAKLIHEGKYSQAELICDHILPQIREEAPNSLNLAICLENYGTAMIYQNKCEQSIAYFDEAIKIIDKQPFGFYQQRNMFQILGAKATALRNIHKFDSAECEARKAIAYAIAFPNIAPKADTAKSYVLLCSILQAQNKIDEANRVVEISGSLK